MAHIDTAFMKKVLYITERKRKSNVHHYCKSDDFRAGFEVAEWGVFCHSAWSQISPARFKQVYSDSAAYPIAAEENRILFCCKNGFLTMVRKQNGLFKNSIKTDFFIRREIIDAAENGLGLIIRTKDFNLDLNFSRPDKVPIRELNSWLDLEEALLELGRNTLTIWSTHNPVLENFYFDCPCGRRHNLEGRRADYQFNQPLGGFCVPLLAAENTILSFCSRGYYCLLHDRPSVPVEWFFKVETTIVDPFSIPVLPADSKNSKLPQDVIEHIRYVNSKAHPDSGF